MELDTIMPPQADYGREARFFCKLRIKLESYHICWSVELPEWSPDQMLRKLGCSLRKACPPPYGTRVRRTRARRVTLGGGDVQAVTLSGLSLTPPYFF